MRREGGKNTEDGRRGELMRDEEIRWGEGCMKEFRIDDGMEMARRGREVNDDDDEKTPSASKRGYRC